MAAGTEAAIRHRMIDRVITGQRCRAVRTLPHPISPVTRHLQGRVRYGMENLGRTLLLVDWDDGKATLVFPTDVELCAQ
jgi:hypothetical protein